MREGSAPTRRSGRAASGAAHSRARGCARPRGDRDQRRRGVRGKLGGEALRQHDADAGRLGRRARRQAEQIEILIGVRARGVEPASARPGNELPPLAGAGPASQHGVARVRVGDVDRVVAPSRKRRPGPRHGPGLRRGAAGQQCGLVDRDHPVDAFDACEQRGDLAPGHPVDAHAGVVPAQCAHQGQRHDDVAEGGELDDEDGAAQAEPDGREAGRRRPRCRRAGPSRYSSKGAPRPRKSAPVGLTPSRGLRGRPAPRRGRDRKGLLTDPTVPVYNSASLLLASFSSKGCGAAKRSLTICNR